MSKGVALCDRSRLSNLKYSLHHQLVRLAAKSNIKAALKTVEKLISEVESQRLTHWAITFRFLRVCLSLQSNDPSEMAANHKHLAAMCDGHGNTDSVSVRTVAATLQALVCVRSGASDAIDRAQRSIAGARTHQLDAEMGRLPSLPALREYLDLQCSLIHFRPAEVRRKKGAMQQRLDATAPDTRSSRQGICPVGLGLSTDITIDLDTCGILTAGEDGKMYLPLQWTCPAEVQVAGFLLTAYVAMVSPQSARVGEFTQCIDHVGLSTTQISSKN